MRHLIEITLVAVLAYPLVTAAFLTSSRIRLPSSVQSLVMETYDGPKIDDYFNGRPWPVLARMVKVGPPLLAWWLSIRADNLTASLLDEQARDARTQCRAVQLRQAIVESDSPCFIKFGQALAQRGDVLRSPIYARELEKLQDAVGTFPSNIALSIIKEELGLGSIEEVFELDPATPVASASLGQVYRARLKRDGSLVAIKVQRPGALTSIAVDMYILRRLGAWYKKARKLRTDMVAVADVFAVQLFQEVDYRQEAKNARRFKELHGTIEGIVVPEIVDDLTTRRVLTQQWIEGEKGPWKDDGGRRMLALGLRCSTIQLFATGYYHADPHRGNLLKTGDNPPRLAYLDFGSMATVSAAKRYALLAAVLSLQARDLALLTESLIELEFLPDSTNLDIVVPALENAFRNASGGSAVVSSRVNITQVRVWCALTFPKLTLAHDACLAQLTRNLQEISSVLPVRLPPFFSLISRTLTLLEGLALNVDPDFRIVRGAFPYIASYILDSTGGGEDREALQTLLRRVLITQDGRVNWKRLEQFISVSRAAESSDYRQLKVAQNRSDIRRSMLGSESDDEEKVAITIPLALRILQYLLSPNGAFLREALVEEIVETVETVQLVSFGLPSVLSGGMLKGPNLLPSDRKRLAALIDLVMQLASSRERELQTSSSSGVEVFLRRLQELVGNEELRQQLEPLIRSALPLLNEIQARLVEKNLSRIVRNGFALARRGIGGSSA